MPQAPVAPADRVLEIGSGWGGFALHAAKNYECQVTTTTISRAQFATSRARVKEAGLADRITLLERDYRDLTGQFDKLVSIEMIEAVGHQHFDEYFRQCGKLLKPTGSLMLQAIVMPERRYERICARSISFSATYSRRLPPFARGNSGIHRADHGFAVRARRGLRAALRRNAASLASGVF